MKTILNIILLAIACLFANSIQAQDTIRKKNGEVLKVVVKEINDSQIKYYHFDDPNQVLFTLDRMMVTDIKFSYGREYKEEEPIMTDDYFADDQNIALTLSMSSFLSDAAILSFDKAIDPKSGYQITAKVFGIGFGPGSNNYRDRSGVGIEAGYRLKLGSMKKKKWEYRPQHLLSGGYIMPLIGFNSLRVEYYESKETYKIVHVGLNFGKKKVIQNKLVIDYYGGFAFYGGSQKRTYAGAIDESFDGYGIEAGDLFGDENFAFTLGFKVGFAFGNYGEQKSKLKKRK